MPSSPLSIAILVHANDSFANNEYLGHLVPFWKEAGHRVTVVRGPRRVPADVAILHVDLTVIPRRYAAVLKHYPVVINGAVLDISKRRVSAQLLGPGDDWKGKVIVKTDLNSRGFTEVRFSPWRLSRLGITLRRLVHRIRRRLTGVGGRFHDPMTPDYLVLDSLAEVPARIWNDRRLVVERFLPEERDGLFGLRTWVFFGDQETNSLSWSPDPIVKGANVIRREEAAVPDDLRQMRRSLGFDYGKFDYVIHEGKTVLFDANRTPSLPAHLVEKLAPALRKMASGLDGFVRPDPMWSRVSSMYRHYGPPLLPTAPDTALMLRSLQPFSATPPRVLILGVTPALFHLPWPEATDLLAVDLNRDMIDHLWPGKKEQVLEGDWSRLPLEAASRDIVVTDGGLQLLSWPETAVSVLSEIRRVLVPSGRFAARLFVPPARRETPSDLLDRALAGAVANASEFKVRMWSAMDEGAGVATEEVRRLLLERESDFERLAERTGWTASDVRLFDVSCRGPGKRWIPAADHIAAIAAGCGFELVSLLTPEAPWGELCPTATFRKVGR
jgi:SAM-dependent methyltransferase